VFVRFSNCNMECTVEPGPKSPGGFDCDTEFESGRRMTAHEIVCEALTSINEALDKQIDLDERYWVVLTGGEPALQVDLPLLNELRTAGGFMVAIETNGSIELPWDAGCENPSCEEVVTDPELAWCPECASRNPADENRAGAGYPPGALGRFPFDWITVSPKVAEHAIRQRWAHEVKYVRGYGQAIPESVVQAKYALISPAFDGMHVQDRTLRWCQELVMKNPEWRLSLQSHKTGGGIR
jgi:organic radical activating enzyme